MTIIPLLWLNIGAGESWSFAEPPWINIDVRAEVQPDLVADARSLPYANGIVARVYAGHILEHLALDQVGAALAEWLRVLEPGGRICVVGPDVDKGAALFAAGEITRKRFASLGHHSANEMAIAENRRVHGSIPANEDPATSPAFHHWECSGAKVLALLSAAGYADVVEVPIGVAPFDFPVYDRTPGARDQFCVLGRKP